VKRSILAPIAVLIFILIGLSTAPFWFGMEAEQVYQQLLARPAPGGVSFTHRSYTRGWLSSTAENVINVRGAPVELVATHHIYHGPFQFARLFGGEVDLTPVQAVITTRISIGTKGGDAALKDVLAQLPELVATTTIHLNGSGVIHLDLPSLKRSSPEGGAIDWRGLSGDVHFDGEWKQFVVDMQSAGLVVNGPAGGNLSITNVGLHSNTQEDAHGLMLGDGQISIGQFSHNNSLTLDGLAFRGATHASGDNVNLSLGYRVGSVQIAGQRHGPGELAVELRNLDGATLQRLQKEMDAIVQKNLPPEQARMMLTGKLMELLTQLARKSPEIEVTRLSFKSGDGELTGKGKLVVDGSDPNVAQNPLLLLVATHGDAELMLPPAMLRPFLAPFVEKDLQASTGKRGGISRDELARLTPEARNRVIDRALPMYLSRHPFTSMLVADNGRYKLVASLHQGKLLVNGQPWNPTGASQSKPAARPRASSAK
jgi:uncharacterized protein YdgA (DUF945 family)